MHDVPLVKVTIDEVELDGIEAVLTEEAEGWLTDDDFPLLEDDNFALKIFAGLEIFTDEGKGDEVEPDNIEAEVDGWLKDDLLEDDDFPLDEVKFLTYGVEADDSTGIEGDDVEEVIIAGGLAAWTAIQV